MNTYTFKKGNTPLLVSMPHDGTFVPADIAARMTDHALTTPDTDWHISKLYDFLDPMGASIIAATHSRYVVDLNRPIDNSSLYPGQDVPGLCPVNSFDQEAIYHPGQEPNNDEIKTRIEHYWQPYHQKLEEELYRIKEQYGYALLWDAHSIKSQVPRFFEGQLPDLNLGTADNAACSIDLSQQLLGQATQTKDYSSVLNGRFKGGFITRRYGQPDQQIHAVQLELSQVTYMEEVFPFTFNENKANKIRPILKNIIQTMLGFNPQ